MGKITNSDKEYLLSLTPEDLTFSMLVSLLGDTSRMVNGKIETTRGRFNCTDEFDLRPADYFVTEATHTTVGKFIYNKFIVERLGLQDVLGYVNMELTNGNNGKLEAILSEALLYDKMTVDTFKKYIDYRDMLGMQLHSVITCSYTMNVLKTPPSVKKHREELFNKYDKELKDGNIIISEKIEKTLMDEAKAILKDDPGMDLFNSSARGNFANYKNSNIFKGATYNNITGKYDIVKSSFMDGIEKEDIPSFSNSVIAGAYPKAVGTQVSGYMAKQLIASLQAEKLDEPGTDCGSKATIPVLITEKTAKDCGKLRYIMEGGKPILLNDANISKYYNKIVHMRSPMTCIGHDGICNVCAGELSYMRGTRMIGLECCKIATTFSNLNMKKFHIANLKSVPIDPDDMLI